MSRGRVLIALGRLLLPGLLAAAPLHAQPSEKAVKAAFLPKFARYVAWPPGAEPGAGQPYQLCIIGRDPFGRMVDQAAAGEVIEGHPVTVRRLTAADGANGCHLAFVGGDSEERTQRMLAALARLPVLTITDDRLGKTRGMIHFLIAGGRVRFLIDDATADAHGINLSSRLLALAISVTQRPQ